MLNRIVFCYGGEGGPPGRGGEAKARDQAPRPIPLARSHATQIRVRICHQRGKGWGRWGFRAWSGYQGRKGGSY